MRNKMLAKKIFLYIVVLITMPLFVMQCRLFGPEPGEPVFPAPIDPEDSAAVRSILDLNNLKKLDVRKVIDQYTRDRITMLEFDSLGLDSFCFSSDFEKLDSLSSIDLSSNKINKLNFPDSLRFNHLYSLDLEKNLLTSFPIGIFKINGMITINGLVHVNLDYNKISDVPQELINAASFQVYLEHNKLCSVTDTTAITWLDSVYGVDWKSRQDCP